MTKRPVFLILTLFLFTNTAIAEQKNKKATLSWEELLEDEIATDNKKETLSWEEVLEDEITTDKKKAKKLAQKKSSEKSNWSFFWQALNRPLDFKLQRYENGLLFYAASQDGWSLYRFEPYIKLNWSILDKYLSLYLLFGLDATNVKYALSNYKVGSSRLGLDVDLVSRGNMFFGGGVNFLLIGWKYLTLHTYLQTQMTPKNDAAPDSAILTVNENEADISDSVKDHVTVDYQIQRYDVGVKAAFKYKWFSAYANFGYIWFDVNINLLMDEDLANTVRFLTNSEPRYLIPNRLSMKVRNIFGTVGTTFKLYKWLNIGIEGIIVPDKDHPIYFGQFSIIIQD